MRGNMLSDRCRTSIRITSSWDSPSEATPPAPCRSATATSALNVWVEAERRRVLLIGKTDAWDENSINLKLGRVRMKLSPNATGGSPFRQTLRLRTGDRSKLLQRRSAAVRSGSTRIAPVIHIDADSESPFELAASLEMWRTEPRTIKTQTGRPLQAARRAAIRTRRSSRPIASFPTTRDRIVWCHHNQPREHDGFEINMRLQGLGGFLDQMPHPLLGRTFGAAMQGRIVWRVDETTLASKRLQRASASGDLPADGFIPRRSSSGRQELDAIIDRCEQASIRAVARRNHDRWWDEFWNRSWI